MSCDNVITVQDLETDKKHSTFYREVITGKAGGTGADIDSATNAVTGQTQSTLPKVLSNVGFSPAGFDFTTGGTLTERDKAIFYQADGNWYSWGGALPKVVPPASSPASTGGIADSAWNVSTSAFMYRDWEGFTAELLAQAGITDDGQPDEVGNSKRVDAISKICGRQFTNVSEMLAFNGFQEGQLVSTGGTTWEVKSVSNPITIADFAPKTLLFMEDFKSPNDADHTNAIQQAITTALSLDTGVRIGKGTFTYDNSQGKFFIDTRATLNFKIVGSGFSRINVIGSLNNTYTFDVASKSSRNNFVLEGIDIHYKGTQDDVGGIAVSRNGLDNLSEWGGTCEMIHVWLAYFTRTNLYLKRNYLSTFTKTIFTGADEGTYNTGNLLPAVPSATSSCVYISGGDPGDPVRDFSNCMKFIQCEFQGAKFGIRGYHVRQTDFDNCVWQYCWIGLSNIVDNIHGAYNLGDISFSGTNYFEYIANRALADMEIDDDGTTVIDYGRQSIYTSTAKVEFNAVNTVQLQARTGELIIKRAGNGHVPRSLMVIGTDAEPKMVEVYGNGIIGANKGVDFANTVKLSATNNHRTLDAYQNEYSSTASILKGSATDPIFTSRRSRSVEIGRTLTVMFFGAVATQQGSGNVFIKPERQNVYMQDITSCQILYNFGSGANGYNLPIFAKLGFSGQDQIIDIYKDAQRTQRLTYSDLVFGTLGGSEFAIAVSFITGNT